MMFRNLRFAILAAMKPFRWNHDKNEALKVERDISFEVIALAIEVTVSGAIQR